MKNVLTNTCTRDVNKVHQQMHRLYYDVPIVKRTIKKKYVNCTTKTMREEWYDIASKMKKAICQVFGWYHSMLRT